MSSSKAGSNDNPLATKRLHKILVVHERGRRM